MIMAGYQWKMIPLDNKDETKAHLFWMYRGVLSRSGYKRGDKSGIQKTERER